MSYNYKYYKIGEILVNILNSALSAVSSLQKTVTTKIYNKKSIINNGIADFHITEVDARVHAQALTMKELETFNNLEVSTTLLKFYIMGDKAEIVDFFKNQDASNSIIVWNNDEYSIYGKISWQSDRWIKVYGVKNMKKREMMPL